MLLQEQLSVDKALLTWGRQPSQFELNFTPHDGHNEVLDALDANFALPEEDQAAIIEIIASRGYGKTLLMSCGVLVPYLDLNPGAKVMWVGPTYNTALSPIEDIFKGTDELSGKRWVPDTCPMGIKRWEFVNSGSTGPTLKWWNSATVSFKSADAPLSIVSRGYNLIIIDEAALIEEQVFTQQIMGTARKLGIKVFIITSPRGKKHWTYKYFLRGQDKKNKKYLSFQQPFTKNPHFNPVLASLIKDLPEWIYKQEYLAEFLDDGDSVFRNLDACLIGEEIQYESNQQEWRGEFKEHMVKGIDGDFLRKKEDRRFIVSMDLAKSQDYTVIFVTDLETGDVVYYKRLNKTDYREVIKECVAICHEFNSAELIFDATGVGGGVGDFLNDYDVSAHGYVFTNDSKSDLVNRLILSLEYAELKLPNIKTIRNELSAFTYTMTRTGKISYNAPSGFHDDIVMSLALGNWWRKENVGGDEIKVLEAIIKHNNGGANEHGRMGSFRRYMHDDND